MMTETIDDFLSSIKPASMFLELTVEEAWVIDWVLTMHSWDFELKEWLEAGPMSYLRVGKNARVLLKDINGYEVSEGELKTLMAIVPVTFPVGAGDAGWSLKQKLYRLEHPQEAQDENTDSDKDEAEGKAEGST